MTPGRVRVPSKPSPAQISIPPERAAVRGNAKRNVRGGVAGTGGVALGELRGRRPSHIVRRQRVEFQFCEPAGQFAVAGTFDSNEPTSPHNPASQLFEIHSDLQKYPRVEMTFAASKPMFVMSPPGRRTVAPFPPSRSHAGGVTVLDEWPHTASTLTGRPVVAAVPARGARSRVCPLATTRAVSSGCGVARWHMRHQGGAGGVSQSSPAPPNMT